MSLESIDHKCKQAFFQFVSEFGSEYIGRYHVSENEIKQALGRQRATDEMWRDTTRFFQQNGYSVSREHFGLYLELTVRSMASSPNDQFELADALRIFRLRAGIQGDLNNM